MWSAPERPLDWRESDDAYVVPARLVTLVLVVVCALLAPPGRTLAVPPEVIAVDDVFVDGFISDACGIEVVHTVTGTIRVSEDKRGSSWPGSASSTP